MSFNQQVWNLCKKIPKGKVSTYGELARALDTKAYQAVGNAMNKNPYGYWSAKGKDLVPCHRVINSDGKVGGFAKGQKAKIELLKKEGVEIKEGKIDLSKYGFIFYLLFCA